MIELSLNGIQKYYGANKILEDVNFDIKTGEKVALIGSNGSGKTTIFKIITGKENYDEGQMFIRKGAVTGYLDQIPEYPCDYTVLDVLSIAFEKQLKLREVLQKLEADMKTVSQENLDKLLNEYTKVQSEYECIGGYEVEEKLSKICTGLNFSEEYRNRKFCNLSGGEKTSVVLGKILLEEPDILLLDEPSNHLDMNSIEWLEEYLKNYKGTILIISHDRYFLDNVVSKIIELEDKKSKSYKGNYSQFLVQKEENLQIEMEAYKNQQKKIQQMEKTIKNLKEWGNEKFDRRAKSMEKRLEKMEKLNKPKMEKEKIKGEFKDSSRSGNEVVIIENLHKSFGDNKIFQNAEIKIMYGERAVLIGKNGSGKSTLFKILMNQCNMDSGKAQFGSSIKLGYLPQNVEFNDEELSVIECFREDIEISEGKARGYLAKFLFKGEDIFKKIKNLSGGEKSRVMLSKILYKEVNLLLMDEPTNHLDLESREALEELLNDFDGTILFISHDRYFINSIAERVIELNNLKLDNYLGNYDYFKLKKSEQMSSQYKDENEHVVIKRDEVDTNSTSIVEENHSENNLSYEERKLLRRKERMHENKIKKLEDKIEELENKLVEVEKNMELYSSDYDKLKELFKEKEEIQNELDMVYEAWSRVEGAV